MKSSILDKISYHAVYDKSIVEALEYADVNGFSGIQIAIEAPHLSFEKLTEEESEEIRKIVMDSGLNVSVHCPDEGLSLFEHSSFLWEGKYKYFEALFNFSEKIMAKIITLHIGHITTYSTDTMPEVRIPVEDLIMYEETFKKNLDKILKLAGKRFIICVENYNLDDFTLKLLQPYLDNNEIYLCWDLAKTFTKDGKKKIEVENYFFRNIDKVRQIHIHDLNSEGKSHRIIGTGIVDFTEYLSLFEDKGIIDYCIEVRPRDMAKKSLENLKMLLS